MKVVFIPIVGERYEGYRVVSKAFSEREKALDALRNYAKNNLTEEIIALLECGTCPGDQGADYWDILELDID